MSARLETVLPYAIQHKREDGLPGGKCPDPYWGGLTIICGNEAKCRPSLVVWCRLRAALSLWNDHKNADLAANLDSSAEDWTESLRPANRRPTFMQKQNGHGQVSARRIQRDRDRLIISGSARIVL